MSTPCHPHTPHHHQDARPGFETGRRNREEDDEEFSWENDEFPDIIDTADTMSQDSDEDEAVPLQEHALEIDEGEKEATSQIPSELRDNTVTGQEYDAYMASGKNTRKRIEGKIDLKTRIDHIDKRLVAKFRVQDLFRRIKGNSLYQMKNFERGMSILQGKSINQASPSIRCSQDPKK